MTITVQSNDPKVDTTATQTAKVDAEAPKVETTSAPEAQTSEQNQTSESETEETVEAESTDHAAEETETEADHTEQSDKPSKKGGWQRRIDKKTKENAELKQRVAYLEQLALKSAGTANQEPPKVTKPVQSSEGKPNQDDFETHTAYVEALTDWKVEQKQKEFEQKAAKQKSESEQQAFERSHFERVKAFADKTEDFEDVIENLNDVPRSIAVETVIKASEKGPELLYELAKNPEEAKRIATLPPLQAALEMGKLESRLTSKASAETKQETKKVSSAPKPLAPVSGGGKAAAIPKTLEEAAKTSFADYKRIREEQLKQKRRHA